MEQTSNSQHTRYIDWDEYKYEDNTVFFLRKKLDDFTIETFRKVIQANKNYKGLVKTRLSDYHNMRKRYDSSFLMLESQGFIEKREDGTATPYFVTSRGKQLIALLKKEKNAREENIND